MEIGEFIAARLAEDEEAARAASGLDPLQRMVFDVDPAGHWSVDTTDSVLIDRDHQVACRVAGLDRVYLPVARDMPGPFARHIARQDPAATLARVEALRALVGEHGRDPAEPGLCAQRCAVQTGPDGWMLRAYPCPTLRHVAAIRRDHEDYDERWKP